MKIPTVYLLSSKPRGTLYAGVTSDVVKRVWQHREGCADGFTSRHGVKTLVWYEQHPTMASAIAREKAIKRWPRQRKFDLIQRANPKWRDLWSDIAGTKSGITYSTATPANLVNVPTPSSMVPGLRRDDDIQRTRRS
ncbi:MAG: GIY-YIG nuclease family protein [Gemmatimonadaceae bacterium]